MINLILKKMTVWGLMALLSSCILTGCYKREPIYDEVSKYTVRFEVDSASVLHMMPRSLGRLQLSLYDPSTEKEVFKMFFSENGGNLYSIYPGKYKIAVWSMNSDYTSVTYTDRFNLLTAESMTTQETPVRVIAAPDHVFAYSNEEFEIPYVTEDDPDVVFTIPLKSVIDTWRIEVEDVKGLENFQEANFFIYNQAREIYLKQWRRSGSAVDKASGKVEGDLVVSEFGTFGMPEDERVSVVVKILAQNGFVHEKTIDVTEQIKDPENTRHIIRIQFDTTLNPMEQGGLNPSAEEWNENIDRIDLL